MGIRENGGLKGFVKWERKFVGGGSSTGVRSGRSRAGKLRNSA